MNGGLRRVATQVSIKFFFSLSTSWCREPGNDSERKWRRRAATIHHLQDQDKRRLVTSRASSKCFSLSTNLKWLLTLKLRVGNDSDDDERPLPQTITIKWACKFFFCFSTKLLIMRLHTGNKNNDIEQPTSHTITNRRRWMEARDATRASKY